MNPEDIRIYELSKMDLSNALVIDGFPGVGLVSTIAANYLISVLGLKQIGILDSVYFPTVSVIRDGEPNNPVRIYGSTFKDKDDSVRPIVVFTSEFQIPMPLVKPIASTILDWVQEQKCWLIVSPEGIVIEDESILENSSDEESKNDENKDVKDFVEEARKMDVYAVCSTKEFENEIDMSHVKKFSEGVISGVAGVLLNEGKRRGYNVLTLLAETEADYPDARAAARIIEALNDMVLGNIVDVSPLYVEAESIEMKIKSMHKQAEKDTVSYEHEPEMYG